MTVGRNDLFVGWAVLVCSLGAYAAPGRSTNPSSSSTIALIELPPRRVAFVQHVGPYWTLGRVITKTRQQMADRQRKSPLFIRYATDPGNTKPDQLAVEVGFVLLKGDETSPPFLSRTEPASTAITLTTDEPTISPRVAYAELLQWASVHDLTPMGPMTELHYAVDDQNNSAHTLKLVFQMPLVSKEQPVETPRSATGKADAGEEKPDQGLFERGSSVAIKSNTAAKTLPKSDMPLSPDQSAQDAPAGEVTDKPDSLSDDVRSSKQVKPNHSDTESIPALFASANYDALARRLMPGGNERTSATLVWLGQLSFRITAAAKGLQSQYPDEGKLLLLLSKALRARYAQLAGSRRADALLHATARVDGLNEKTRTQLAQIMRSVDLLLARISFQQVSPASATAEILKLLDQTATVLDATMP